MQSKHVVSEHPRPSGAARYNYRTMANRTNKARGDKSHPPSVTGAESRRRFDPNTAISLTSCLIALVALLISIRSCEQAERSSRLAEAEFDESRSTTLRASVTGTSIRFEPTNSDTTIDTMWVTLPRPVLPTEFKSQNAAVELEHLFLAFKRELAARAPDQKLRLLVTIPIGIRFVHVTKSDNRLERQAYEMSLIMHDGLVEVHHVSFVGRLQSDAAVRAYVDEGWANLRWRLMIPAAP
jgi:hypothetical protein